MTKPVNQIACKVCAVNYILPTAVCDRCQQRASGFSTARRTAIDIHLDHPVLLQIKVSVHYCAACDRYFRLQPPFMRPDAIYSNRVVEKAVQSVYEDGMAMRRVTSRMARDFWVEPSEGAIRGWCRSYAADFDFATDYQAWVVEEFSGILCVDEVYQDQLALLLAVDPAAPDGDRLVGYLLVHGAVNAQDVADFLTSLKVAGIVPEQVITDGSSLYPTVLRQVWPEAAHQLCLFHETRRVTKAAMKVINAVRRQLPQPPPALSTLGGGPLRSQPPSDDPTDPASQRWVWRQMQRRDQIAQVHDLAQQGLSQRAISRQTGHHRKTVKQWLQHPIPSLAEDLPVALTQHASQPTSLQRKIDKQALKQEVHTLAQAGHNYSVIAHQVGIHRVTVKAWLQQSPVLAVEATPISELVEAPIPPPEPWSDWDEVKQIREALQEHRFLLLRRADHLNAEEQEQVDRLLASPVGPQLQVIRSFLTDWYALWRDEHGQRRDRMDAQTRFQIWRSQPDYQVVPQLKSVQDRMTDAKFDKLSQFLRHSTWEATNNGAERTGRLFRHQQAAHFNLRSTQAIENLINVTALQRKQVATRPSSQPFHTCQRGRTKRPAPLVL